jgi:ZIP family zinc transporter
MIYLVIEELIPESHREHSSADLSMLGTVGGFTVMMILDMALK